MTFLTSVTIDMPALGGKNADRRRPGTSTNRPTVVLEVLAHCERDPCSCCSRIEFQGIPRRATLCGPCICRLHTYCDGVLWWVLLIATLHFSTDRTAGRNPKSGQRI